jgi:medium-chain acyl-[acyl-carrier-protein] hydrolase
MQPNSKCVKVSLRKVTSVSHFLFFRPQPRPNAKIKLFVFHHAGGSASSYHKWHKTTPEWAELNLVELPGRGRRAQEPAIDDFKSLIGELSASFYLENPKQIAFFGHSMGALLAFELAHLIKPVALGISSLLPPIAANIHRRAKLSELDNDELIKKLAIYSPLPDEILSNAEILNFYIEVIRHDLRVMDSYEVKRYPNLEVPTMVFGGRSDTGLKADDLEGWRSLCAVEGPVNYFDGGHFYLNKYYQEVQSRFLSMVDRVCAEK